MLNKYNQTINGSLAVARMMARAADKLELTPEQLEAFCDETPNGELLFRDYLNIRKAAQSRYSFALYMIEILSETPQALTFH